MALFDMKAFRKHFGLTQSEVAEMFNCEQTNISGIERSGRELSANNIINQ